MVTPSIIDPPAPPAPPANPADPVATLKRKLLCLRNNFSPRLIAIIGDILQDKEWSVPIMEPILVVDDRIYSAGDNVFSVPQLDRIFARIPLVLSSEEQHIWDQKYRRWKKI